MFSRINSMGLFGIDSYMVGVEVDCGQGLPRIDIVGLPDTAVNESKNSNAGDALVWLCGRTKDEA